MDSTSGSPWNPRPTEPIVICSSVLADPSARAGQASSSSSPGCIRLCGARQGRNFKYQSCTDDGEDGSRVKGRPGYVHRKRGRLPSGKCPVAEAAWWWFRALPLAGRPRRRAHRVTQGARLQQVLSRLAASESHRLRSRTRVLSQAYRSRATCHLLATAVGRVWRVRKSRRKSTGVIALNDGACVASVCRSLGLERSRRLHSSARGAALMKTVLSGRVQCGADVVPLRACTALKEASAHTEEGFVESSGGPLCS